MSVVEPTHVDPSADLASQSKLKRAAVATAVLGGVAAVLIFAGVTICPFALTTRHPCPGCGMTRAVLSAVHGDFRGSFHHHPLAIVMVPLVAYIFSRNFIGYVRNGRWSEGEAVKNKVLDVFFIVIAVAMMVVWIARFFGALGGPEPVG